MNRFTKYDVAQKPALLSVMAEHEQTFELCQAAIQISAYAIRHVKRQTPELCLLAVKGHPHAIVYVKAPTHEVCLAAIEHHDQALLWIKNQTPELCMAAVKRDGFALMYVTIAQTRALCVEAVSQKTEALEYVSLPYDRLMEPQSQQLEDWIAVLQACRFADNGSTYVALHPLVKAIPLGKKYMDGWGQALPGGIRLLDRLLVLVDELTRLAFEDARVKAMCHKVNQQVEWMMDRALPLPQSHAVEVDVNHEGVL